MNIHPLSGRARSLIPSGAGLVSLLPLGLLYWQAGGPEALLADPDTGVHVRAGEWILRHHAIPRQDWFSFTLAGRPWCDWEWLADVLDAVLYHHGGFAAIVTFNLLLVSLIAVIVYRTARLHAGGILAWGVTFLVMTATTIHWLARPHLFSWLFVAVFCGVIERSRATEKKSALLILPPVTLMWVNLHPGFVAGLLILAVWCGSEAAGAILADDRAERLAHGCWAKWFAGIGLMCLLATLANPYGVRLDQHIAAYLFSPTTVTAQVAEWLSPDFHNPRLGGFELLLPLAAAALWQGLEKKFAACALTLGWMHLALVSVRNVPLFAIVCAPPVARLMEHLAEKQGIAARLQAAEAAVMTKRSRVGSSVGYGIAGLILIAGLYRKPLQLGSQASLPVEAAEHLPAGFSPPTAGPIT